MKKWTLFLLLVILSGPAQAHHRRGHQNTEPHLVMVDCGKVDNFIKKWEALRGILNSRGKDITFEEWRRLEEARNIFANVCHEV